MCSHRRRTAIALGRDLVERCIDRKLWGNLPRCPSCGIGRLKVAYTRAYGHGGQGTFTCPGGYDDDAYTPCFYRTNAVERPIWRVVDDESSPPPRGKSAGNKSAGGPSSVGGKSAGGQVMDTSAGGGATSAGGGATSTVGEALIVD